MDFIISFKQLKLFTAVSIVLFFGLLLTAFNIYELHRLSADHWEHNHKLSELSADGSSAKDYKCHYKPVVWIKGKTSRSVHLTHIREVFYRLSFEVIDDPNNDIVSTNWTVLWSHNYPFKDLKLYLQKLKDHQLVNHFPGSGFITNKVTLAISNFSFVPKSFKMPLQRGELIDYASKNKKTLFVKKSNHHRGIKIEKFESLDLTQEGTFIQKFINNPLLVDGHKFDIGVYVIITSVHPFRIYIYEGDILFRFCPEKYYPFDSKIADKYVIGEDYLPIWKVDSLKPYYVDIGLGMKESFNAWLSSHDKDSKLIWNAVKESIRKVFLSKENSILDSLTFYASSVHFFEIMRFDFIIDEDLQVYLMEANMSPNLSSVHFKENKILYEQVLFNAFSLLGIGTGTYSTASGYMPDIQVAVKDISVFPEYCKLHCRQGKDICTKDNCQLCSFCLSDNLKRILAKSYLEHLHRRECRRVMPPPIEYSHANEPSDSKELSADNVLIAEWFRGKCLVDQTFCI